jgi:hypothetical protein
VLTPSIKCDILSKFSILFEIVRKTIKYLSKKCRYMIEIATGSRRAVHVFLASE